ncbi:hypothetical protein TM1040_3580 (plasmid) [Ruegeria sp. TM1040]|nr:hypothetical protein TM1040_3580 [Ruegeria sp. TM1040]
MLVGRNSAGKSTFLRSLPLIRQSLETRSSAPILWYGDFVDFGDFQTAVSSEAKDGYAVFSFKVRDLEKRHRSTVSHHTNYLLRYRTQTVKIDEAIVKYYVGAESGKTALKKISLEIPSEDLICDISYRGRLGTSGSLTVNGEELPYILQNFEIVNSSNDLFSAPSLISKTKDANSNVRRRHSYQDIAVKELERFLRREIPRISSSDTFRNEVANILSGTPHLEEKWKRLSETANTASFRKYYENIQKGTSGKSKDSILTIQRTFRALQVLDVINDDLQYFFSGVSYLGPARAAGERFYRKQELEVSEILPNGSNFPMFLDSLSTGQKRSFSDWVESIFGYGVELKSHEGHISIHLKAGEKSVNVTDTGYGVSQILPVLATVWWSSRRTTERWGIPYGRRQAIRTIAIEQPELHLHPAHQAKLADVFVKGIKLGQSETNINIVNILIETHSEALINRLGELIELGSISSDDVQVIVFAAEDDINSPTRMSVANFDSNGALENWPFGFFNYS